MPHPLKTHKLSNVDYKTLTNVKAILDVLNDIDHRMPLSYARAFVEVALHPGKGPSEIGRALNVDQPIMSRTLSEIGDRPRSRNEKLGLVELVPGSPDARLKECYMTHAGLKLMYDLIRAIR